MDLESNLGAEAEATVGDEQMLDEWLDAEFEAEAGPRMCVALQHCTHVAHHLPFRFAVVLYRAVWYHRIIIA